MASSAGHHAVVISSANRLENQRDASGSPSRLEDFQHLEHSRSHTVEPGKYQAINVAEDRSLRRSAL